ncbi:MAG TPA: glycosyltransferase [archaeon]|nr:glycosyltransferase [archaeon]
MLVSIVIGALNEEKYIGHALKTAKKQKTRHKIELIVGDGFSEDLTVEIAEKYADRIVKESNRSAAWERQAGVRVAKGEIVAITDADADIPHDWIEKIASEFGKDKSLVGIYGPVYFSDAGSFQKTLSKIAMAVFLRATAFLGLHNPIGSNIAFRRSALMKVKGFDTSLVTCEDLDLVKRISKEGRVKFCPHIYVNVSARRVKKWGYMKFTLFHVLNALNFHLFKKASRKYEPVR